MRRFLGHLATRDNGFGGPLQTVTTKIPNKSRTNTLKKWIPQQLSAEMLCIFYIKKKLSFFEKMDTKNAQISRPSSYPG